jgi:excisionase family DNA binding protein
MPTIGVDFAGGLWTGAGPAKVMTLEEVSRYLHVHSSTVYRLLKRGEIPAFRIGSDWRFNIETIDMWRSALERSIKSPV